MVLAFRELYDGMEIGRDMVFDVAMTVCSMELFEEKCLSFYSSSASATQAFGPFSGRRVNEMESYCFKSSGSIWEISWFEVFDKV